MKAVSEMSNEEVITEARRRDERRAQGLPLHETPAELEERIAEEDLRLEKEVEHAGDRLMLAHGFSVVRFSQPRATKQTPGISDRLYIHSRRTLAVWWEAKTGNGVQSPAQRAFQELIQSVGWRYLVGTTRVLEIFLGEQRVLAE
jgi:hypothetical protein